MLQHLFQQRYQSNNGLIIVAQEGLDPAAGESVYAEDGQPAPDGSYEILSADRKQVIEVREGVVHHYYQRRLEKSMSTGNSFLVLLLVVVMLFLLFKMLGK